MCEMRKIRTECNILAVQGRWNAEEVAVTLSLLGFHHVSCVASEAGLGDEKGKTGESVGVAAGTVVHLWVKLLGDILKRRFGTTWSELLHSIDEVLLGLNVAAGQETTLIGIVAGHDLDLLVECAIEKKSLGGIWGEHAIDHRTISPCTLNTESDNPGVDVTDSLGIKLSQLLQSCDGAIRQFGSRLKCSLENALLLGIASDWLDTWGLSDGASEWSWTLVSSESSNLVHD